jgi:tetratricopeptide (TPR) repeat protein
MNPDHPALSETRRIQALYDQGLLLQAYREAEKLAPLRAWRGVSARLTAGRLARTLEAPDLGKALLTCAYRENRTEPRAIYFYSQVLQDYRGPLSTWEFIRRQKEWTETVPAEDRADWFTAVASALTRFRDFAAAGKWLDRAVELAPEHDWIWVQRSFWLEAQDRYEEALGAARRAHELHPWYRPAVAQIADLLRLLQRDEESLKMLQEASRRQESPSLEAQLAVLQTELGQHEAALKALDRYEELAPLMEKPGADWLAGKRADLHHLMGDHSRAIEFARRSGSTFFKEIVQRMEQAPAAARRVQLPVDFVRQHHATCGPATLSALSRFWGMPYQHMEIVEKICWDGTSDHSERQWAEENGFFAREFSVTWESAVELLSRQVPFALTTSETTYAHLQAIIGFDERRGTLLVRDPYQHPVGEWIADVCLKNHASTGPRGMALVPQREKARIADLALPDADLYDDYYRLQRALSTHDRATAARIQVGMAAARPEHRLVLQARRVLALYDRDTGTLLDCLEKLLELFPRTGRLLLSKFACLQELARRDEALEFLRKLNEQRDIPAVFWQRYAQLLSADIREAETATRLLRRAIRHQPGEGLYYHTLAGILWDIGRFDHALELYRFASCVDDKDEYLAMSYFRATRFFKQAEAGLEFLRGRCRDAGAKSSMPVRSLFNALELLERPQEALDALEDVIRKRPEDADLLLFTASSHSVNGNQERGAALIEAARGRSHHSKWLRTAAELADLRADYAESLKLWLQVAEAEPLATDAHRNVAGLMHQVEGRARVNEYLQRVTERFPHHYDLNRLRVEWMRDQELPVREPAARKLIETNPSDTWARRELAVILSGQRRFDEALAECDATIRISPREAYNHSMRGWVFERAGRLKEAEAAYREAIRLSVDSRDAIEGLLELGTTDATRREALAFVQQELKRQVIFGEGLLAFRRCAKRILPPEELLAQLREAHEARPDLWHSWSALIEQLLQEQKLDEALELAREATRRFPLLPRLWLDLADVCRARHDAPAEREAVERALQINPKWSIALRRLAEVWERQGDRARERETLEKAVARDPLNEINLGFLADALWRAGEKQAALEKVRRAVELEPGYDWAWDRLVAWGGQLGQKDQALEMARELTRQRPGEARSWWILARRLNDEGNAKEALDRVVELNPRHADAHDLRALNLVRLSRFDEALAACRPAGFGEEIPSSLLGRAAWIEAERGNRAEAIRQMRAVVERDSNYYWGWRNLADWHDADETNKEYLEAGEALVRISPDKAEAYGYRGDARLRSGSRAEGKADLQKSIELDPSYRYGGSRLFDEQLADNELEAAARTVEILRERSDDQLTRARSVQLCAKQGNRAKAVELLSEICRHDSGERWPLDAATEAMKTAGWTREMRRALWRAMDSRDTVALAGGLWAQNASSCKHLQLAWKFGVLLVRKLRGGSGVSVPYIRALADTGDRCLIHLYVRVNWRELQSDTLTWGNVCYALAGLFLNRTALRWIRGCEKRPGLKMWMMANVITPLHATGRFDEAVRMGRFAFTLPADHTANACHLWQVIAEALAGDIKLAAEHLQKLDASSLTARQKVAEAIGRALVEVAQADAAQRRAVCKRARARMREAWRGYPHAIRDPELCMVRMHGLRRITRQAGGLVAWFGLVTDEIFYHIQ